VYELIKSNQNLTFAYLCRAYAAIPEHFNKLYSTLGAIGYHPQPWRQSTTVVIPKPNKPDYSNPKAYQTIALLNCLGKVLEKLMASRISGMVETHNLLYPDQIGGRPQRSAIDAAMALTHDVKMGRSKHLTMTALFLDVQGAFDNVSSTRLTSTRRQFGCTMATATPPCDLRNHHQSHRFFHRIRIRHTQLRTSVNCQSVTRRFRRLSSRN
jgi:hypothetical protein